MPAGVNGVRQWQSGRDVAYKDGEDHVAEVARRACHGGPFLGLLFEPLVLFGGLGALHLVYLRAGAGAAGGGCSVAWPEGDDGDDISRRCRG